tara:strand:+ start:55763 stop:56740 length:978 start_codon:yes stop_codon:yes gene_type:complete
MPEQISIISGGVGGAKLVEGLYHTVDSKQLSVIPNVADDDEFYGLWVSPDVDTLLYTLSNRVNRDAGWGIAGDTLHLQSALTQLGRDSWMTLGDQDLATHITRSERLQRGQRPTDITTWLAAQSGIDCRVLLPTDDKWQTRIESSHGVLSMQQYFVKHRHQPTVKNLYHRNITTTGMSAEITPETQQALEHSDLIFIAPSNPLLSIGPTLAINGVRECLTNSSAKRVAVSPLIGGKAVKGPTAEVMTALGYRADVLGIADYYHGLIDTLVIDEQDQQHADALAQQGLEVIIMNTLMDDLTSRQRFARSLLDAIADQQAPRKTEVA